MKITRPCAICCKQVNAGMTNNDFDFCVHEGKCFEKYMDEKMNII